MATGVQMQQRRATEADWTTSEYILAAGELGVTTDTGILKIGDGVNDWSELPIAFESQYLPLLGTAANSELLEGISSDFFVKYAEVEVDPENDSIVKRTADGGVKVTTATETNEAVNLSQMNTAISSNKQIAVQRTVTASTTLVLADLSGLLLVNHSSLTAQVQVTIPTNASVAFPVGAWIDIVCIGVGGAKILAAGGVTISGSIYVMPDYSTIRALKTSTDAWILLPRGLANKPVFPKIRAIKTTVSTYTNGGYTNTPYDSIDATKTYNPDNDWFSLPGSGLTTGRRIIINQAGEYEIMCNYAGALGAATIVRISKFTADNVSGDVLAMTAASQFFNLKWRGQLAAGESVGVNHGVFGGTNDTDTINAAATPNEFRITLVGK
jgi:hypothetical protein